jgi:hypothetical protein
MMRIANRLYRSGIAAIILTTGLAMAQDQPPAPAQTPAPTGGGWRRAGDQPPAPPQSSEQPQTDPSEPVDRSDAYGQSSAAPPQSDQSAQTAAPPQNSQPYGPQPAARPPYGLPAQLVVKPGTYVQIRTNQYLASNKNQVGDIFTGSLSQPLIVDGVVLAPRGQMVAGRVAQVGKANDGRHVLKLELTSITLADGNQARVYSQLASVQGPRTPGAVQAGTVAGTTTVGAAIGAVAGWGTGAAIGAGVGALAGIAGVIATRNHPAAVYPESVLTFQITSPVTVSTLNAPQAFRYAGPEDHPGQQQLVTRSPRPPAACGPYGCPAAPAYPPPAYYYGGPVYYPGYYAPYPYYWGPGVGVGVVIGGPRVWRRW